MLLASVLITTSLGACVTSEGALTPSMRITLPAAPDDVSVCLRREFPEIPDRALTKADVVRIIGEAKVLDRTKTACGLRAVQWIESVSRTYSR